MMVSNSKRKKTGGNFVEKLVSYFAEDHGLQTFFIFVLIVLLAIFLIVVFKNYI